MFELGPLTTSYLPIFNCFCTHLNEVSVSNYASTFITSPSDVKGVHHAPGRFELR